MNVSLIRSWIHVLLFTFVLAACGTKNTPPATPQPDSAAISRPAAPSVDLQKSQPEVCECVLRFDHLNIEQGLSQSSVYVSFQDSRGFMWFGTQDGLNRYDGYTFKIFKPDPDISTSLSDRWITAITEDTQGYLWIGTLHGGLNRYDPFSETFTHYKHDETQPNSLNNNRVNMVYLDQSGQVWAGTPEGLELYDPAQDGFKHFLATPSEPENTNKNRITSMLQDRHGRYWLGTAGTGLKLFDPANNTFETYQSNPENAGTLSFDFVTALAESDDSIIWVGTRNGLNRFDPSTGRFDRYLRLDNTASLTAPDDTSTAPLPEKDHKQNYALSSNVIHTLAFDGTGKLWVGTANGLNRFKPGVGFVQYFNDPAFSRSLSENVVVSLYKDRSGNLWIGTEGGGVNLYDPQRDLFAYYRHDPENPNSLPENFIFPIHVDSQGYAWIGTQNSGLSRFSWVSNQFVNYSNNPNDPNSLGSNEILSLYEDRDGTLWVGTFDGLDRFNRGTNTFTHFRHNPRDPISLSSNVVHQLFVDRQNQLWVGTSVGLDRFNPKSGGFVHYTYRANDEHSISSGGISAIIEDRQGHLWVGTFDNGLNRFDPRTGLFTRYHYDPQQKNSLNNNSIMALFQDSKGRIWVGTLGGGLSLYHPETDSFTAYIEKDGLPNGVVYGILEDESGNLWLSTNFGLSRFNPETELFRNFDVNDGLQSNEFNSNAFAQGKFGEVYFGGINGLTVFEPGKIVDNPITPPVVLTSLSEDNQPLPLDSSVETVQAITLQWPQNSMEFDFAALGFSQPDKNQYAYFLENFDTNWHFIGTKRTGRYTNLPGGKYTLLLKAANSNGVWSQTPTRVAVTVIPPYWQTNWFRGLLAVTVIAFVAGGFRLRTRAIQDRNRALERIVTQRTQALEERNQEMAALYQADERILRNVSLNQVYQTLVDVAVDMLHADRSVVFAWDEKQTRVAPRVSHGFAPETLKVMNFAKGEGNVGTVLATGKPIIARELDEESMRPDVYAAIRAEGIRSFMHLPIIVDHKVVAVFNAAFTGPLPANEDSVRVFSALVNRAAISIANMELFEQTKDLAVMEERNRLARDLHDSAKQKAFAALAQLGTARGVLNGNGHLVSPHLNEAENLVADVIQELTFLVQEIYPIALQEKGLATTLREYIFEWENRNDAKVNFSMRNERRLPLEIEQALYRVTQEALANVARHSQARRVDLALVYDGDTMQLSLSDDGQGFDMSNGKANGMGLRSIRERISSVHGTVQIQSAPGQGTRLIVQVPTKG